MLLGIRDLAAIPPLVDALLPGASEKLFHEVAILTFLTSSEQARVSEKVRHFVRDLF